jgi:hypothetical protein
MLVCDLVSLVLLVSVPVAAWFGVLTMGQLLVVAMTTGAAAVFFSTAYFAYLPAVVGREDLAEGNAKLQGSESAALLVGPGLGGVLAQAFGAVLGLLAVGTARGLLLCDLGSAPFVLLLPLTGHGAGLLWFVLGGFVRQVGMVAGNVIFGTFRQTYCPPALLGRVTACTRFAVYGTISLGAVLGGVLGTALGVRETMWIATAADACSALNLLAGPLRRRRDFPSGPVHARARLQEA